MEKHYLAIGSFLKLFKALVAARVWNIASPFSLKRISRTLIGRELNGRWKYRPWKRCDEGAICFPLSCPRIPAETLTEIDVKTVSVTAARGSHWGFKKWTTIFYGLWRVFTLVTSIYANLLEKKERLHKTTVQVIKDCQRLLHTRNPSTQAASGEAINEGVSPLL